MTPEATPALGAPPAPSSPPPNDPLPAAPPAEPTPTPVSPASEAERAGGLSRLFGRQPQADPEPPKEEGKPPESKAPALETKPPAPPAEPPATQPAVAPKPPEAKPAEQPGKPAQTKPDDDKLPEDILEGIPEQQPANHREAARNAATMRRRLRTAGESLKKLQAELEEAKKGAAGTPPPDYEEIKGRAQRLEEEVREREQRLNEANDRLYATELRERPEYKQHVTEPWKQVTDTIGSICKKYGQNPAEVYEALRMEKREEREAVLDEIISAMNSRDQINFNNAVESIPAINHAKNVLEANSKERLEALRSQDKQKTERERETLTARALAAQENHSKELRRAFPMLFEIEGDEPEVKEYNTAIAKRRERAAQLTRAGLDKLPPEMQGMVIHDALVGDQIMRGIAGVLQSKDARIKALEAEKVERDTAFKTMESELNEFRGGAPGGEGAAVTGEAGATGAESDLGSRLSRMASRFNWKA